jgi:hypothetical protein
MPLSQHDRDLRHLSNMNSWSEKGSSDQHINPSSLPAQPSGSGLDPFSTSTREQLASNPSSRETGRVSKSKRLYRTANLLSRGTILGSPRNNTPKNSFLPSTKKGQSTQSRRAHTSSLSHQSKHTSVISRAVHFDLSANRWDRENPWVSDIDANGGDTRRRFIVGIDYGTTFTSVSYHVSSDEDDQTRVFPHEIGVITEWPHDGLDGNQMQLPTETWYSSVPKNRGRPAGQFELSNSDSESTSDEEDQRASSATPFDPGKDEDDSAGFYWGYHVPYQKYFEHSPRSEDRRIERLKSMLLRAEYAQEDQRELRPRINRLITDKIIRKFGKKQVPDSQDVQDPITDFLIPVLRHTRRQLIKQEGLTDQCHVSFVLTVPIIWDPTSLRILQTAMEGAIREAKFGTLSHGSVDNLFIVSEPEAAATYLVGNSRNMLVSLLVFF